MNNKFVIFAVLMLLWPVCPKAGAQDFKVLPWQYDRWLSEDGVILRYDKFEHAIRDGALNWGLGKFGLGIRDRLLITSGFALSWEVRDGLRWRHTDGASMKDFLAGLAGQAACIVIEKVILDRERGKTK